MSTQLRGGKFKQRPCEKRQGRQLHNGVRPSIAPSATKQQRQSDDKARVGQERVRRDSRYRDPYGCTSPQMQLPILSFDSATAATYESKKYPPRRGVAIAKRCDDLVNRYEKDIRQRGKLKQGYSHR